MCRGPGRDRGAGTGERHDPWAQLTSGCQEFLTAGTDPDLQRIMLIDGPAVLAGASGGPWTRPPCGSRPRQSPGTWRPPGRRWIGCFRLCDST
ncbi:hypothetical protein [Streptomyces spinoverrucosus]|uniref:hypothetical protein n=1 Tax=Streptomyces spinoverrucosus TaxID=284043 RepID=UPI0035712A24